MLTKNKCGLTLTELVVSTIMIAIIMGGIAAFSLATKQIQQTTSKTTKLNMRLAGAMEHIKNNAYLAIGFQGNPGIRTETTEGTGCPRYFAFRQDNGNPNPTPDDYSDDKWVIYTDGDDACSGSPPIMYACVQEETDPFFGGSGADVPAVGPGEPCDPDAHVKLLNNISFIDYSFDPAATAPDFYFDITITIQHGIWEAFQAGSAAPAVSVLDNPEYSSHERFSPPQHSW